jgi:hypothetical protein
MKKTEEFSVTYLGGYGTRPEEIQRCYTIEEAKEVRRRWLGNQITHRDFARMVVVDKVTKTQERIPLDVLDQ